jgi:hypothetical protein
MAESIHPAAPHHLPSFITAPGDTDVLMVVTTIFLTIGIMMFGVLFFRLHTLPERIAHKSKKIQFEIVAILGLIALITHMHIFWIAGLLLAVIDIPDFGTSLNRIAGSAERIADQRSGGVVAETPRPAVADGKHADGGAASSAAGDVTGQGEATSQAPAKPAIVPTSRKEHGHA